MTSELWIKLAVMFMVVAVGWGAGRTRLLGGADTLRAMSNLAFYVFTPALLFRATARIDFHTMPWGTLIAFFGPAVAWLLTVYAFNKRRERRNSVRAASDGSAPATDPAMPTVRAITASFGNTLQLGLPFVAAVYGDAGLSIHVTVISLHALTLLTLSTLLVELDIARAAHRTGQGAALLATLAQTAKTTLIHPVILPVMAGMVWNLAGLPLWPLFDAGLQMIGSAVVPVCLVLIGLSLAHFGLKGAVSIAFALTVAKMLCLPLLVLLVGHGLLGQTGVPLAVIVMAAALPVGTNALLFAQRYRSEEAQTTAAILLSTLAFVVIAPFWLTVLARL